MRRPQPLFFTALILLAATVIAPVPALAETFLDLYGGGSFPLHSNTTTRVPGSSSTERYEYEHSFLVGGRAGYYFEGVPRLGLALDASYFKTDSDWPKGAKYHVVPISVLLMVRAPLNVTQEFPNGRFQPYLGIGPSLVYSRAKSGGSSDTSFDVGFDLHLGLTWMVTKTIGLFGEYRFSYAQPDYDLNGTKVEPEFIVNHVAFGVTFRF
jgi:opacity protein-like surface antigen